MFVILVKTPKTTEKMLSVWLDIGATRAKLNSFRENRWITFYVLTAWRSIARFYICETTAAAYDGHHD
jgi:hypothetical protein